MCVPVLWVCHTATKSSLPAMCQHVWRGAEIAEDGACSAWGKDNQWAWGGHQSRALLETGVKRQKPRDHKQGHKTRKALWLHLCLASWGCNLGPVCLILLKLKGAAQLSQGLSNHCQLSSPAAALSSGCPPLTATHMTQGQTAAGTTGAPSPSGAAVEILSFPKPGATQWLLFL